MSFITDVLDDLGDFFLTAETQGLKSALSYTQQKLTGKPVLQEEGDAVSDYRIINEGKTLVKQLSDGITRMEEYGEANSYASGEKFPDISTKKSVMDVIDPSQFVFGSDDTLEVAEAYDIESDPDQLIDLAFAGRPGAYSREGEAQELVSEDAMWLTAKPGGGLMMSSEGGTAGLSHLKKIFDLDEYDPEAEVSGTGGWGADKDYLFPEFQYNLVIADGEDVKAIIKVNDYETDKNPGQQLQRILDVLDKLEATDVYHLDAGVNSTWQIDRKPEKSYDYDYSNTIYGRRIAN